MGAAMLDSRRMRVGALGAFSIANAGDVLLGEASRQAVLRRRPDDGGME